MQPAVTVMVGIADWTMCKYCRYVPVFHASITALQLLPALTLTPSFLPLRLDRCFCCDDDAPPTIPTSLCCQSSHPSVSSSSNCNPTYGTSTPSLNHSLTQFDSFLSLHFPIGLLKENSTYKSSTSQPHPLPLPQY